MKCGRKKRNADASMQVHLRGTIKRLTSNQAPRQVRHWNAEQAQLILILYHRRRDESYL